MIIKILILIALLRVLDITRKPFLCSGIYGALVFVFSLMFGNGIVDTLIITAVSTALASVYFWLLDRFNDGLAYWGIMIGGLFIGLI